MAQSVNKYLRLFRLGNCFLGSVAFLITCFIAAGWDVKDSATEVVLAFFVVFAFIAGGNSLNDYIDVEIDKTAHPERPLVTGELSRRTGLWCGILGLAAAIVLALFINIISVLVVVIAVILMVAYEVLLKQRGFVGNVDIAVLTGMVFIFGGAVVDDFSKVWVLGLLAALVSIGREIAKDIEDQESDEGERKTLPMMIGARKAAAVSAAFFVAGPALSFIPLINDTFGVLYLTVVLADIIFIYCAVTVFKDAHKAEKFAKVAMFAALIAFVLGVVI
ncbi:4-hydroxybenzoate polyprenyltransferase-related prenyltransferase [Thermoplasmatales archaeon BRNA1]|nr:4-hydroxybenzoate polyprenyltransferase-related prenyltransferase [Thermoplasmatales archaeon BRNA1]